jgi:hypothetical protein
MNKTKLYGRSGKDRCAEGSSACVVKNLDTLFCWKSPEPFPLKVRLDRSDCICVGCTCNTACSRNKQQAEYCSSEHSVSDGVYRETDDSPLRARLEM